MTTIALVYFNAFIFNVLSVCVNWNELINELCVYRSIIIMLLVWLLTWAKILFSHLLGPLVGNEFVKLKSLIQTRHCLKLNN